MQQKSPDQCNDVFSFSLLFAFNQFRPSLCSWINILSKTWLFVISMITTGIGRRSIRHWIQWLLASKVGQKMTVMWLTICESKVGQKYDCDSVMWLTICEVAEIVTNNRRYSCFNFLPMTFSRSAADAQRAEKLSRLFLCFDLYSSYYKTNKLTNKKQTNKQ